MNSRPGSLPVLALMLCGAFFPLNGLAAQQAMPPMPSGPIEVNGIAARVYGTVITKNQVSFLLASTYAQLVTQFPRRGPVFEAKFKEAKARVIQELIDREIILYEFKSLGAVIKPHVVDDEIKDQVRRLYNGDEVQFREQLKNSRLTMDGYREMTREKMIVQAMRAQQFSDAPPPLPDEIRKEYNEIKINLRDVTKDRLTFQKIFIPASDPANPTATPDSQLALAEDLVRQLASGKDFAELAKTYSKDAFAETGGLQENTPRLDLSNEFAAIIVDAPIGKIIGPLLDRQGFTIVKPIKIEFGPSPAMDDKIREMVEDQVRKKKNSVQYTKWIESKRKRANVKIMD